VNETYQYFIAFPCRIKFAQGCTFHRGKAKIIKKKKGKNTSTRGWEMANQPTDVCTWSAMRRLSEHPAPHIGSVMKLGSKKLQYSENMKTRH